MTLAEFQPHVERAIAVVEQATAAQRRLNLLTEEHARAKQALDLIAEIIPKLDTFTCPHCGLIKCTHIMTLIDQREPLLEILSRFDWRIKEAINEGEISELPLRSIPIDLITEAVVRRIMHMPAGFPILRLNTIPSDVDIQQAVYDLSQKWRTTRGPISEEVTRITGEVTREVATG